MPQIMGHIKHNTKTKLNSVTVVRSELYRPSNRRLSTKLVPNFAGKGCCLVNATKSHSRQSRFSRPEPQLFYSNSSSIVIFIIRCTELETARNFQRIDVSVVISDRDILGFQTGPFTNIKVVQLNTPRNLTCK
jgi:hypothetical protein